MSIPSPYLEGLYAPVDSELSAAATVVFGDVPRDLHGAYVRNGPNPKHRATGRHHWFDGDGMLHSVTIDDGAVHYRSRYIRTEHLAEEDAAGSALWRGLMESTAENPKHAPYKDTANTDILCHDGSLIALWYVSGKPYRIDATTLETQGVETFGRERATRMTAHAKVDPRTGELFWFDYGPRPPFMRFGAVSPSGTSTHITPIDLPGARLPHDMALTENHVVLMDLPVFHNEAALRRQQWIVDYHRDMPARFGIASRAGGEARWFEAEPCYVYHSVNAWEEGDEVVMVGCRCVDPIPTPNPDDGPLATALANLRLRATLHRWRFNLADGSTKEEALDDLNVEFPTIAMNALGQKNRWGYAMHIPDTHTLLFDGVAKYDLDNAHRETLTFDGGFGSEVAFAARDGATEEDDGYLLSFVQRDADEPAELWIIRAQALSEGPVARVRMPRRIPLGFHACWVPS